MLPPADIRGFTERQRQLIHDTYDSAWRSGVEGYEPDADPVEPDAEEGHDTLLAGVLLLKARSRRKYVPPAGPDPGRRQQALQAALASTETMAGELASLGPSPAHIAQAEQEADEGLIEETDVATAALGLAMAGWAASNAFRLNAGESVAWAGEQAGYAEAADADGMLLQWQGEEDDSECQDCLDLEQLGPLPLSEFPTMPGQGDTECNVGCRCALEATGVPLEDELAPLSDEDQMTMEKISSQATERTDRLAPNFA